MSTNDNEARAVLSPLLMLALDFAAKGYKIFPQGRDKVPLVKWKSQATTDSEKIIAWHEQFPTANFATALNDHQLVLDVDVKKGQHGGASLLRLRETVGIPDTLTVRTGSGGWHLYFTVQADGLIKNRSLAGYEGVEAKSKGGCITLPGSLYADGTEYVIESDAEVAEAPEALVKILGDSPFEGTAEVLADGQRNAGLTSSAGKMRQAGLSEETLLRALLDENQKRCNPPLPESEVKSIAASIGAYAQGFQFSDLGNAERLVARHGEDILYCDEWRRWVVWTGSKWEKDSTRTIRMLAKDTVRSIYQEAADTDDEKARKTIAQYAVSCESATKIKNMIELATSEVPARVEDFDTSAMLLNVANGTIDLRSGDLREHRRDDLFTKQAPVTYDRQAICPRWASFLDEIMAGDQEMIRFLQKIMGYCLTGRMNEARFFIFYGSGRNGKSRFLETIGTHILGEYAVTSQANTFLLGYGDRIPADIGRMPGARLVFTSEVAKNRKLDEQLVKQWVGEDRIGAEVKYGAAFDFQPVGKIIFRTNYRPVIEGQDKGIWYRAVLIPFEQVFEGANDDKELGVKLAAESSGILNWLLDGCVSWQLEGLEIPTKVQNATAEYREDMDVLGEFMDERVVLVQGAKVQPSVLYGEYLDYCESIHEKKPWSSVVFGREIKDRGFQQGRTEKGRFWIGVGLR